MNKIAGASLLSIGILISEGANSQFANTLFVPQFEPGTARVTNGTQEKVEKTIEKGKSPETSNIKKNPLQKKKAKKIQ